MRTARLIVGLAFATTATSVVAQLTPRLSPRESGSHVVTIQFSYTIRGGRFP